MMKNAMPRGIAFLLAYFYGAGADDRPYEVSIYY